MQTQQRQLLSLGDPYFDHQEEEAVQAVIKSAWLTNGERVQRFESEFARLHGVPHAIALSNCTVALHLCLVALGIGTSDKVLVPSLSFVATTNAVIYAGARPTFVDLQSVEVPHIDIEQAEKLIDESTKAIMIMHYGGYVADPKAWRQLADRHNIFLIEDAAHSPCAPEVGLHSHMSAFSFFSNKNMTTGEGGMILCHSQEMAERLKKLRSHGMTTSTLDRYKGHAFSYDVPEVGYNYRLDELRAAVGSVQLSKLAGFHQKRAELVAHYREQLQAVVPEIQPLFPKNHPSVHHLMPVLLPSGTDRQHVMQTLKDRAVQSSIHYPPTHLFSAHSQYLGERTLPITEEFAQRELTLPLHPQLTLQDVDWVVESLKIALHGN